MTWSFYASRRTSGRRKRLLYLTHRVPYPPDKGDRIRNFQVLQRLSQDACVSLACLQDEPADEHTLRKLEEHCERVAFVPINALRWLRRMVAVDRSLSFGGGFSGRCDSQVNPDMDQERIVRCRFGLSVQHDSLSADAGVDRCAGVCRSGGCGQPEMARLCPRRMGSAPLSLSVGRSPTPPTGGHASCVDAGSVPGDPHRGIAVPRILCPRSSARHS